MRSAKPGNHLNRKIAPIKRTIQACLFFFPFLLLFYEFYTVLFRGNEIYEAILFQFRPDYSVFTVLREKHSFMVSTNFLFEWLRSNSPSKDAASTYNRSEKLARNSRPAVQERVAILLGMFQAKETWISSARFGLWLVYVSPTNVLIDH